MAMWALARSSASALHECEQEGTSPALVSTHRKDNVRLPAAVRRTVESSSYGPDCLHSERLKDSLHLA